MNNSQKNYQTMLDNQDLLMLVDAKDQVVGKMGKVEAHQKKGSLHRAITVALVNDQDQILVAQRSQEKPLWPGSWDLSCSTHPWYPDETVVEAAVRRLPFELGLEMDKVSALTDIFSYEYHAVYSSEWSENEYNHLLVGRYNGEVEFNHQEVAQVKWLDLNELERMIAKDDFFAPWVNYVVLPLKEYVRS